MVMMDRVIGGSGCSFSALIVLKLFPNGKSNSLKQDMDFEEAFDGMLENELEDEELEKPFKWYSFSYAILKSVKDLFQGPKKDLNGVKITVSNKVDLRVGMKVIRRTGIRRKIMEIITEIIAEGDNQVEGKMDKVVD